jgi:hypothetical protein
VWDGRLGSAFREGESLALKANLVSGLDSNNQEKFASLRGRNERGQQVEQNSDDEGERWTFA